MAERSPLVGEALSLARELHLGEWRDTGGGEYPFMDHLISVGDHLAEEGQSDIAMAAGLLHDALEYSFYPLERIRERFGVDVAAIVYAMTEDMEVECYEERKDEVRERVADTGFDAWMVFAADKTSNVEALLEAYAIEGEEVDEDLEVDLSRKIFVWEEDLEMLFHRTPEDAPMVDRFSNRMVELWTLRCRELRRNRYFWGR